MKRSPRMAVHHRITPKVKQPTYPANTAARRMKNWEPLATKPTPSTTCTPSLFRLVELSCNSYYCGFMKHLDWKSFAIGILLTSTVIFGSAASRVNRVWDNEQKWMATLIKMDSSQTEKTINKQREQLVGWELIGIEGKHLIYRRPLDQWSEMRKLEARFKIGSQLHDVYP